MCEFAEFDVIHIHSATHHHHQRSATATAASNGGKMKNFNLLSRRHSHTQ
jgi:hypothetical protein